MENGGCWLLAVNCFIYLGFFIKFTISFGANVLTIILIVLLPFRALRFDRYFLGHLKELGFL